MRVLGQELRTARMARGWTRKMLADKLPSDIGERTVLSYEEGIRNPPVLRMVELCKALGVSTASVMEAVENRLRGPADLPILVNVHELARDGIEAGVPESIVSWAKRHVAAAPDPDITTPCLFQPAMVWELAVAFDLFHAELARVLLAFSVSHD